MATGYYLLDHRPAIPQCGYPRRGGARASGTIILHDAEGGTDLSGADTGAENVANYIRNRTTYGSYHRLVDRDTRIKMAPIDYETWHSVPDNPWSVGISVAWNKADLPRMTYAQRRSYYVPFAREVLDVRAEFADRGIRVPIDRFLTAAETQDRKPGISTHSRTDPSRRSDPFGTGSKYEAEFLAVLAELGGKPTTPQQEEPDMDATQAKQLSETRALVGELEGLIAELHAGVAPKIDKTAEIGAEKITLRTAIKETRLAVLGGLNATVTNAVKKALAGVTGIDKAAITKAVTDAVETAVADAVGDTEYVLTPKEN
jgi:hypothetical protein